MFETRGARGIEPETFRRRGQLLSCPPTTGPFSFLGYSDAEGDVVSSKDSTGVYTPHVQPPGTTVETTDMHSEKHVMCQVNHRQGTVSYIVQ